MKKYVAGAGVAAALLTGSIAIAAWSPIGLAGAQDPDTTEAPTTESTDAPTTESTEAPTTETTEAPTTESTEAPASEDAAPEADKEHGSADFGPLSGALDELVAEGVITQEQADAIRSRVDDNRKEWESEHPRFMKGFNELRESTQAIADALGMPVEDLVAALAGGSSLNDLAAEQGVDPAAVSQILVGDATARIDQAVADGKLPQEKADEIKAKIAENIGKVMDGSLKDLGGFGGRRGGQGPGGD